MEVTPSDLAQRRREKRYAEQFGDYTEPLNDVSKIYKHFTTQLMGQDATAAALLTVATILALPPEETL